MKTNLNTTEKIVYTPLDVSQLLGISRANAYNLFHVADFPSFNVGRRPLVLKEDLDKWIQARKENKTHAG